MRCSDPSISAGGRRQATSKSCWRCELRRANRSMYDLARPAIAIRPERALRADLIFRIVDSLFVRAADDPVAQHDRFRLVGGDELDNLSANHGICPDVLIFGEPPLQLRRLSSIACDDRNCYFGCALVIGAVERDGGYRI